MYRRLYFAAGRPPLQPHPPDFFSNRAWGCQALYLAVHQAGQARQPGDQIGQVLKENVKKALRYLDAWRRLHRDMKNNYLLEHQAELSARLSSLESEKLQVLKRLKAIAILLEESSLEPKPVLAARVLPENQVRKRPASVKKRPAPAHAVRTSPRSSLIDAVLEVARRQPGEFNSVQLLEAIQSEYPEFHLTETKHISSPLSDLVKKRALVLEQRRIGSKPNIYKAVPSA